MAFFDEFSLITFAAQDSERITGVFVLDSVADDTDSPHAAIFDCDLIRAYERGFLDERVAGVSLASETREAPNVAVLGQWGSLSILSAQGLVPRPGIRATRGPLMRLRNRFGTLYAVGSGGQAFRSKSLDSGWELLEANLSDAARKTIFTDIDGFSAHELYVSGTRGSLWRIEDGTWQEIPCATNLAFHAVHCADDGYVYACGQLGLLARGRGDSFEILSPGGDPVVDLWGLAYFDGTLFCSGFRVLLEWTGERLAPHMPAMSRSAYFYGLEVRHGRLWSCGEKSILRYDGSDWQASHDLIWISAAP